MKKTYPGYLILLAAAIGLALVASCFLPAFPTRAKQHSVRIQSVNNITPVFLTGTNRTSN